MDHSPLQVALVQQRMHWTGDENTASIVEWIERAADAGAAIALFPELAITGMHRRIAEAAQPALVADWLAQVQMACARQWSAVICRECEDADAIAAQMMADPPDVVVWPGGMRPDPDKPRTDPPEYIAHMQAFARRSAVHVVMVNWPNALNCPEESEDAYGSVVIAPDGAVLLTLPKAQAGMAVFELGQTLFEWTPDQE